MAAVVAEHKVFGFQQITLPHRRGFLPDIQMGGTGIHVVDAVIVFRGANRHEHIFKFPDVTHVPIDAQQVFPAVTSRVQFLLHGPFVLKHRDIVKVDIAAF
ncbi:hypothetical protein SDC9_188959 [bioreactor metagenome]|uniref:Uncharacterized protein n=1 Tax=bioreactor metagenome TaxID=1076179 RepID=A0A645I1N0_9ZZZZ